MNETVPTILIIDDDADAARMVRLTAEKMGWSTQVCYDLETAEESLLDKHPDVVCLDNSFPKGLGVNFIHRIKRFAEDVKVIMITADPDPFIEKMAWREGADAFLRKPFTGKNLLSVISQLKPVIPQ